MAVPGVVCLASCTNLLSNFSVVLKGDLPEFLACLFCQIGYLERAGELNAAFGRLLLITETSLF